MFCHGFPVPALDFFLGGVGGLWSTFTLFSCFARKAWTDYCIKHAEHTEQPYGSEALAAVEH